MACQPPVLPGTRQTKGMDGSQTEFLNLASIKGLNRKLQSNGENVNEPHNLQLHEKDNSGRMRKKKAGLLLLPRTEEVCLD